MPRKKQDTSDKGPKKDRKAPKAEAEKKTKRTSKKKTEDIPLVEAEVVETPDKGGVGVNGNLIPLNKRSKKVQREIQSAGGKARAENLRKQKDLREFTRDFLYQMAMPELRADMASAGVEKEDMTNMSAMVVKMFMRATAVGDLNAARTLIEWAGMAPLQQEKENEMIAKISQAMQLASGNDDSKEDESFVFYIPENGRPVNAGAAKANGAESGGNKD